MAHSQVAMLSKAEERFLADHQALAARITAGRLILERVVRIQKTEIRVEQQ
jgi:hypothetical protein